MKLQRYELWGDCTEKPDGEYVKHSEALDWFESIIAPYSVATHSLFCSCIDCAQYDIINTERARLRALIAAEREQK